MTPPADLWIRRPGGGIWPLCLAFLVDDSILYSFVLPPLVVCLGRFSSGSGSLCFDAVSYVFCRRRYTGSSVCVR